jgi:HSP20 family protein
MATATLETKPGTKPEVARESRLLPPHPFGLMRRLTSEMDRAFEEFGIRPTFAAWPREIVQEGLFWSPSLDIVERHGELLVRADLPGLVREDVKVTVTDEILTIEGERKRELKETTEGYFRSECSYGRFLRTVPLPEGAMGDKTRAVFRNGVLEITIPVPPKIEKTPYKVEVK